MDDCLQAGVPPGYVTSHPIQLSLAIHPWVGAISTSDGFGHRWERNSEFYAKVGPVSRTDGILI